MDNRVVSLAQARANLPGLVKEVEEGVALDTFLEQVEMDGIRIERGEFEDLRDRGGRAGAFLVTPRYLVDTNVLSERYLAEGGTQCAARIGGPHA